MLKLATITLISSASAATQVIDKRVGTTITQPRITFTDRPITEVNGNKVSNMQIAGVTVPVQAQEWDLEDTCWISQQKYQKASPSLRTCYSQTDQACCNYIQDDGIGSRFNSFIPAPCQGDNKELSLFQCIGCMSSAATFTIKAEATAAYIKRINFLQVKQFEQTLINRNQEADAAKTRATILNSQATKQDSSKYFDNRNGYVKVCASWLQRLWQVELKNGIKALSKPTTQWDQCGVMDLRNDGDQIPYASRKFSNALDFLDWYGIPLMEGFGIIIIDDSEKGSKLYSQSTLTNLKKEECFNNARSLKTSIMVLGATVGAALSLY